MSRVLLVSLCGLGLCWASVAGAEPPTTAAAPAAAPAPLSPEEMADTHAGSDVTVETLTHQQLNGVTSGNTVIAGSLTSGNVAFSPQALSGFSGVGNFVINTGANNTLQGAINISVVTIPAP